jgi:hypothetical protein
MLLADMAVRWGKDRWSVEYRRARVKAVAAIAKRMGTSVNSAVLIILIYFHSH